MSYRSRVNSPDAAKQWIIDEIRRMFPNKSDNELKMLAISEINMLKETEVMKMYREWKG